MIRVKTVTLYTQPECPPCEIVKRYLKEQEIPYIEVNVKEQPNARSYMVNVLKSYSTPTVTVDDQVIKGFQMEELAQALDLS
ncbi:glutaredoxin domain-containing protein [Rossellomorea marisflavi]|uniref:glutaredoxin domain-containing protein n=1 Tax=Rossellomorea TaxID=2837508 RepID=UPI00069D2BF3